MTHEDESPMVAHRSHFDTMPCPPPDEAQPVASNPEWVGHGVGCFCPACVSVAAESELRRRAHVIENPAFHLSAQGRESLAAHGVSLPATLSFEGGEVVIEKPTKEALALSAQQWATRVREDVRDGLSPGRILGSCDRLDAVLAELARML